ncbi:MAG: glycine oxidase ThiO [Cyanobacteria bacterium]|nr:glycine oxidase ThiO [Cyanobacteria bacterium CG_2015-16_32_12]NCO77588.1 glycine oxidase ThiO [Cyanobacteria bacterium CG_2015-22_32_23]NCQ03112.1 glycine oxidase ThiO [Cyanobacteria bacterium CG_2015-09_32_10]NCQ41880.1 glycine oxidase ThiO [Cyanobacteria bacterium CG_2015-04_32_10]NCS84325.1 glycine oxidase ThiO [Cyanobacteria bacterium CG_2015-02_32_10]
MKTSNEIIIIGGGIIGLSIALELKLKGLGVTVLSKNYTEAATNAAAGMLAPRAEQLDGVILDLALQSLALYPEWAQKLEQLSGEDIDYNPCGIIAPVYEQPSTINDHWLDKDTIQLYQPQLGKAVMGGYWYPEEGQVDPRRVGKVLLNIAQSIGIEIKEGVEAIAFTRDHGKIKNILTKSGIFSADTYIVASGAWSSKLFPLPLRPLKGQMLSLRIASDNPLERVIFGENTYLVPKKDGRLIVGATSEDIGWQQGTTAEGINTLLNRAIGLYPPLACWQLEEIWSGFRPATVDEMPILGYGDSDNLIFATGHHRNGILLAPITAQLISNLITHQYVDPLLKHFTYQRFNQSQSKIMSYPTPSSPQNSNISSNGSDITSTNGNGGHFSPKTENLGYLSPSNAKEIFPNNSDEDDSLIIAGKKFKSRLMTGTGKYPTMESMQQSVMASGCEIVTVAVRRVQTNAPGHEGLAEALDWSKIWMLPNTAGCTNAEEAIRVARLGREMAKLLGQEDNNFIKLEVIPDSKYLLPDPIGTLQAAEQLVKEGFAVLPYVNADPLLCKRLEEVGCATVMPLGSPIGSGQGIQNLANIKIIIEQAKIPVVIDAGIGTPSEAALGMELGADALLINSAIAQAKNPVKMAQGMRLAAVAGRLAYQAGRIPVKQYACASSPVMGIVE